MQKDTPPLETIPGKDLLTRPITPLGFTIDGILPQGLFILAGSPKIGKSWLALDMCNAVASGGQFWKYPTTQGDALYLALEDNPARLQERLSKAMPECDLDAPTDIHFATQSQKLGNGLAEQLNAFLDIHPQTRLIVIDTMQYVRNRGKFTGTYSGDYRDMDALRGMIAERGLTLLLVTHTRKMGDADPLNLISGSTGLVGAADGVFVLEKDSRIGQRALLTIANRDTDSHQFELLFDKASCRWQYIAEVNKGAGEEGLSDIIDSFLTEEWSGTATQLCEGLEQVCPGFSMLPSTLAKELKAQQEFLKAQCGITCTFARSKNARVIQLRRIADYNNAEGR